MIFVDTSALLAMLDAADARHVLIGRTCITTSYVLVELLALGNQRFVVVQQSVPRVSESMAEVTYVMDAPTTPGAMSPGEENST